VKGYELGRAMLTAEPAVTPSFANLAWNDLAHLSARDRNGHAWR